MEVTVAVVVGVPVDAGVRVDVCVTDDVRVFVPVAVDEGDPVVETAGVNVAD